MAKIYGNGLMLIPGRGTFMPFSEGVIVTDDPMVIEAGRLNGFRIVEDQPELIETNEIDQPKRGRKKGVRYE